MQLTPPADEKQWEAMEAGHMLMLILDSQRANTLFRSPISPKAQHIIDVGTGSGDWYAVQPSITSYMLMHHAGLWMLQTAFLTVRPLDRVYQQKLICLSYCPWCGPPSST